MNIFLYSTHNCDVDFVKSMSGIEYCYAMYMVLHLVDLWKVIASYEWTFYIFYFVCHNMSVITCHHINIYRDEFIVWSIAMIFDQCVIKYYLDFSFKLSLFWLPFADIATAINKYYKWATKNNKHHFSYFNYHLFWYTQCLA